ncbi:MAG: cytochrome c oxidase assembly protein [Nakamurella sp.]
MTASALVALALAHPGEEEEAIGWSFPPSVVIGLAVAAVVYVFLWISMRQRGQSAPIFRAVSFFAGLVVLGVALCSPIDPFGEEQSFSVHMLQHELLLMVAPLLLVCGFQQSLTLPISRAVFNPAVKTRVGRGVLRVVGDPWIVMVLWSAMVLGWHIPMFYEAALDNPIVHVFEHVSLLTVGLLFWACVGGRLPSVHRTTTWERVTMLGVAMAVSGALGAILIWSPTLIYPRYGDGAPMFGLSPLSDQALAGAIMMAIDMPLLMGALLLVLGRWAKRAAPPAAAPAQLRGKALSDG